MPAPPARSRSASVPCGTSSTSSSPDRNCRSNSLFSPTYEPVVRRIRFADSSIPRPHSSTPQLLLTVSRSVTPASSSASISAVRIPHRPKPPTASDEPSAMSATASTALPTTLSMPGNLAGGQTGEVLETVWRPPFPVDVRRTLAPLRRGAADPCHRALPDGSLWRTTRNAGGAAAYRLTQRGAHEVHCTAWGHGAEQVVAGVADLLGGRDDATGFEPGHPLLQEVHAHNPGLRVP